MRSLRTEGLSRTALAGALVVTCFVACGTRPLDGGGRDGGAGGSAGDPGDAGRGGTAGPGGGGGGASGGGGNAGTGGSVDPCVISCGATACSVRAGQPRVLVTSPFNQQIGAVAVSADTIYWGTTPNQTPGEIRSMPLAGGPSTLLAENVLVGELYLDGSMLYYVTHDRTGMSSLVSVPATGGTSRVIATASRIASITSDASGVYFAQKSAVGSLIMRADRSGSGVTTVVEDAGTLWGLAVDATNIYWASYSNGGALYRRSLAGGVTTTLRASGSPITGPIVDGDDIVFVEGISTPDTCQSAVWSVPKAGGVVAPRLISPGTSGIDALRPVRDDAHLYWSRSGRDGAILRTVKGQTPELVAVDQRSAGPVTLGPSDVYWIAATGSTYEVRTLPKGGAGGLGGAGGQAGAGGITGAAGQAGAGGITGAAGQAGAGGVAGAAGQAGAGGVSGAAGQAGAGGAGGAAGQAGRGGGGGCPSTQGATGARFVNHTLGADDDVHGAGPGACAYKTLTYALRKAPGEISLAPTDIYQGGVAGEQLPFLLQGQQTLSCNGASVANEAHMGTYDGIVQFAGTRNAATECNFDGGEMGGYCLIVNASAASSVEPHVITKNAFNRCRNVTIAVPSGFDHVHITKNSFTLNSVCIYLMGNHSDIRIVDNTFVGAISDVICDDAAPGVTGSGNVRGGGTITCSTCGGCPF